MKGCSAVQCLLYVPDPEKLPIGAAENASDYALSALD